MPVHLVKLTLNDVPLGHRDPEGQRVQQHLFVSFTQTPSYLYLQIHRSCSPRQLVLLLTVATATDRKRNLLVEDRLK